MAVFLEQPLGFTNKNFPHYVYRLTRALDELKQASCLGLNGFQLFT